MNVFTIFLCISIIFMPVATDEESNKMIYRKKWYGPPALCYMFVRKEFKIDKHRECFEYEADCSDRFARTDYTIPIDNMTCATDRSFMKYGDRKWNTILEDFLAKRKTK